MEFPRKKPTSVPASGRNVPLPQRSLESISQVQRTQVDEKKLNFHKEVQVLCNVRLLQLHEATVPPHG